MGLTEAAEDEGYEVPCSGSDGEEGMQEGSEKEEEDEYYCCGGGGGVVVEDEGSVSSEV